MSKLIIKQAIVVLVTATALYFSGFHLASNEGIENLLDAFMVMLFFITLFPFIINSVKLVYKFFKSLYNIIAV
ncbi:MULTISPECIES: hypothetical protein [unclassified Polaribacter]|uniref:hypothetical protein n=1 Tax=unclassified Polaribacter TaxID=196858 RepID=UPI000068C82D|nr:hypothetical protein [Polaribacter sp. MED152]AGI26981.1 putative membrane protein [Polaribacter sp. MED152]